MSLAKKLNLEDGAALHVVGNPAGVELDDVQTTEGGRGIQGARRIAIDEVWSSLGFRRGME